MDHAQGLLVDLVVRATAIAGVSASHPVLRARALRDRRALQADQDTLLDVDHLIVVEHQPDAMRDERALLGLGVRKSLRDDPDDAHVGPRQVQSGSVVLGLARKRSMILLSTRAASTLRRASWTDADRRSLALRALRFPKHPQHSFTRQPRGLAV
jgi:hypothetical protein